MGLHIEIGLEQLAGGLHLLGAAVDEGKSLGALPLLALLKRIGVKGLELLGIVLFGLGQKQIIVVRHDIYLSFFFFLGGALCWIGSLPLVRCWAFLSNSERMSFNS